MNTSPVPRDVVRTPVRFTPELETQFRDGRTTSLIAVNLNTFWSIAVIVVAFGGWDYFVDRAHWRAAFSMRVGGAAIIVATGVFQKLPGRAHWMPFLAKVRLVTAVVASAVAASILERGYGFGVAGLVAVILTGPYIATDRRDLLLTNAAALVALVGVLVAVSIDSFDMVGTVVFVLLAVAVSTLLGRVLEASNRRAFALELELHHDARTDALTGLNNRRAMQERGPVELKRAKRSHAPVSVILCDLDHFKNINDRYGHEAGDAALALVAAVLQSTLRRETDAIGRWGGEEFIAVLSNTDANGAVDVAERMRVAIETTTFDGLPRSTISLGVATLATVDDPGREWEALIKEADQRLYRAKSEGRNRVVATP